MQMPLRISGTGLNKRQNYLLEQLPEYDSQCVVGKKSVSLSDLSALTAQTGVEFAMFTKGAERLIIRGDERSVNVSKSYALELKAARGTAGVDIRIRE